MATYAQGQYHNSIIALHARARLAVATLALLFGGCGAEPTEGPPQIGADKQSVPGTQRITDRFAACFAAGPDCITRLMDSGAGAPAPQLDSPIATIVAAAEAYLDAPSRQVAAGHWANFIAALEAYQVSPGADPHRSAARAPLVLPEGDFAADCATWNGDYREVGGFATAASPDAEGNLSFHLGCPQGGQGCGAAHPYLASIELTAAAPDGATGTGEWLQLDRVPVRAFGNLLVAYASTDLYDRLAHDAGQDAWCVNRPPPCRSPTARAGEVLFAVMQNCGEGRGVLQWGALAR